MSFFKSMLTVAAVVAASVSWSAGASADGAYCSTTSSMTSCDFQSFEQCQARVSGLGQGCIANPAGPQASAEKPAPRPSRRHHQ